MGRPARPTVKGPTSWLKELENAFHNKEGFSAALELFRKHPREVTRQELTDSVSTEDDEGLFDKVKASMSDVYDAMSDMQARTEKDSAMGLVYDTCLHTINHSKLMMEKALYIAEGMKRIERGQDIRSSYTNWYDTMVEVRHSQYVDDGVLCDSQDCSVDCSDHSWFGPQLEQAKRESGFHSAIDLNKFVIACHRMVHRLAARLPPATAKGTGKGKEGRYPRIQQGKGTEEDSPNPKGGLGKGKTMSEYPCHDFAEKGKCSWGDSL